MEAKVTIICPSDLGISAFSALYSDVFLQPYFGDKVVLQGNPTTKWSSLLVNYLQIWSNEIATSHDRWAPKR